MNYSNLVDVICRRMGMEILSSSPALIVDKSGNRASGSFAEIVQERWVSIAVRSYLQFKERQRHFSPYHDDPWRFVGLTEAEFERWVCSPETFRHPKILSDIAQEGDENFWESLQDLEAA